MSELRSEQVIVAAPFSFAGSTRRIWRRWHPAALAAHGWRKAGIRAALVTLLILAWLGVLAWYCLFGLWVVPYRIIRRVQRRAQRNALRHEEMLRAIRGKSE